MKTLKKLSVAAIAILFTLKVTLAAVSVPVSDRLNVSSNFNGQLVKAILSNGEYMPVVDLPEVEIIATKPGSFMVKGTIENGEVMAVVELPTIEITVSKLYNFQVHQYNEYAEIRDIPVIEIVDYFPETNLISGMITNNHGMPLVNLPEVTISVDESYQKQWLAFVNESEKAYDEVEVYHPEIKIIIDQLESGDELIANMTMELEHCLTIDKSTVVCDFVSQTGYYASENLKKGILKLIFSK